MTVMSHRRRPVDLSRCVFVPLDVAAAILREERDHVLVSSLAASWPTPGADMTLGVDLPAGVRLSRDVRVGVGPLFTEDDVLTLPVWWEAAHRPDLFPTFDGGIEVRAVEGGTEVRLVGSYQPPLGWVGQFADGLIGHRFVIASLEAFLTDLTARLLAIASTRCDRGSTCPAR